MTTQYPFSKYSVLGNTFLVVDERPGTMVPERRKGEVARRLCCSSYGLGCDKVVYLQACSPALADEMTADDGLTRWWRSVTEVHDFYRTNHGIAVVRPFNRNGDESALCCNSAIAAHAFLSTHGEPPGAQFVAGITLELPRLVGVMRSGEMVVVDVGELDPVFGRFVAEGMIELPPVMTEGVRRYQCEATDSEQQTWSINAFLTVVGDPHLVLICNGGETPCAVIGKDDERLAIDESFFLMLENQHQSRLLNLIGAMLNDGRDPSLRSGVSVSIASFGEMSVRLLTYERNTGREVDSCGTAAIAAVAAGMAVGLVPERVVSDRVIVLSPGVSSEWSSGLAAFVTVDQDRRWRYAAPYALIANGHCLRDLRHLL